MTKALNQADNASGFLGKTGAKLGQLIRLREIGSGADGNELALRAFESALAIQDLNGAVRAAGQWAGPPTDQRHEPHHSDPESRGRSQTRAMPIHYRQPHCQFHVAE